MVDVTVSIVSCNSKAVLGQCIDSIINSTKDFTIEIVVVDNASADSGPELIKKFYPDIKLIENKTNVGFGTAHNQALKHAKGRYFLILNPDTVIFPESIDLMADFLDNHKKAGMVGCKIWWDDEKNFMFPDLRIHNLKTAIIYLTPCCRYLPESGFCKRHWETAYPLWQAHSPIEVEGITGGIMLVRREVFESAGHFDENFFLFFEEHDLQRRIKDKGWKIYYLPGSEIQHYFEESVRNNPIDLGGIFLKSCLYYYKKHYGWPGYFFIKSLFSINKLILHWESDLLKTRKTYTEIHPFNDRLNIKWASQKNASRYLVEISYSPAFSDRAGMYIEGEKLSVNSDILKRLPNQTGFLRVMPVFPDNSVGKVTQVFKITRKASTISR